MKQAIYGQALELFDKLKDSVHLERTNFPAGIIDTHRCSNCWGLLRQARTDTYNEWYVVCYKCLEHTVGYVTKAYIDRRRSEDHFDAFDARQNLKDVMNIKE